MDGLPNAPEFAPFWSELAEERLSFPYCSACARFHWYPLKRCPFCLGETLEWVSVSGDARLYSWTTVHHRFDTKGGPDIPYTVALVEFPDAPGIRLISNLIRIGSGDLHVGMVLTPCFDLVSGHADCQRGSRIRFRPAANG